MIDATGAPVHAGASGRKPMNGQDRDAKLARQKGVRRTLWITGTIAVVLFLLSILSMVKIG
jgi:hypothetical protein